LIETTQAAHLTGHPNCRQAAILIVAAHGAAAYAFRAHNKYRQQRPGPLLPLGARG
jgi:hypothetical protein